MRHIALIAILPFLLGSASRSFDNTNDEVDMGSVVNAGTGNVSACAWMKTTEDAETDFIIGKKNDLIADAGYSLNTGTGDTLVWRIADGTDQLNSVGTTDMDGAWHWGCGTFDATTETNVLYVDGVQEDTDTGAGSIDSLTNSIELAMGEDGAEINDANGLMSYGMVFTTVLTNVQVVELQYLPERCLTDTTCSGLWFLLGDTTELDYSGNGRAGTVSNAGTSEDGPPVMLAEALPL